MKQIHFTNREYSSIQIAYAKLLTRYRTVKVSMDTRKLGLISGHFCVKGWIS
jgi:hypothetical protein